MRIAIRLSQTGTRPILHRVTTGLYRVYIGYASGMDRVADGSAVATRAHENALVLVASLQNNR